MNLGFAINADAKVGHLSVADKQLVEIAKALSRDVKVLVLDETDCGASRDRSGEVVHRYSCVGEAGCHLRLYFPPFGGNL